MLTFKISIPTEGGFVGRECNNPDCKRYFKIHQDFFKDDMYCPYCGSLFNKDRLWTQDQLAFAKAHAIEEGTAYVMGEMDKMLRGVFGNLSSSKKSGFLNVSVSYKSTGPYRKKQIVPPIEKQVDTELDCSNCNARFQVFGIFGFCPCCKQDNIIVYDTNIKILLNYINTSDNKDRTLRHAYNDLVSTFEEYCKKKNLTDKKYNFQNLDIAELFFREKFNKELFARLPQKDIEKIKRFFQKRHVYQHNKGVIDEKYVQIIPSDVHLLNTKAKLEVNEFTDTTTIMRQIILNII